MGSAFALLADQRHLASFPTRRSSDLADRDRDRGRRRADRRARPDVSGAVSADADRKSTRLNSSHTVNSYAVFCLKKKTVSRRSGSGLVGDMSPNMTLALKSLLRRGWY